MNAEEKVRAPISKKMREALAVVADAKTGEISGWSIATWLGVKWAPEGIRESLRALTNRQLVNMRPTDAPPRQFPDRLKALYAITEAGRAELRRGSIWIVSD
jgi:hypothetical protein